MFSRLRGDQFDPVSEWITNVATPNAGDGLVVCDLDSSRSQVRSQGVIALATQSRVRLLRRAKIYFDSQMHLHVSAHKPASTALSQFRRLGDFAHAQHITIKAARRFFGARGHCELYVIDRAETEVRHEIALPAAHDAPHRFDQLGRIVADAVFENRLHVFDVFDLLRRIAFDHD
jgi:hypothetical protein